MRKESSNQFTEGLVCDLNPINTPNTVLTDALNATIITYDGNEFSLQNDRGNYPLRNCKLKPNYIPVGLKEYADVLYIVSYNPLNNCVEVGSYPSPRNVESSSETSSGVGFNIESIIGSFAGEINYSDLIKKSKLLIYTGDDEQRYKLYPGDRYRINTSTGSEFKYEDLNYFVIDENRKKYDVTNFVIADNEFHNVAWQVPGWLAAQYRLGNFEDFNMSIRSIKVPTIAEQGEIDCDMNLQFQFQISDKLFLPIKIGTTNDIKNSENDIKSDIFIRLFIKKGVSVISEHNIPLSENGQFVEWYLDSKILWTKFHTKLYNLYKNDNIIVEAIPYLKITTNSQTRIINYDHLKETFSFTLNTIGSASDFCIAKRLWKFYTESSEQSEDVLYLEFDADGPNVTSEQVNLYYRIKQISEGFPQIREWEPVPGYTGISDQVTSWIKFDNLFKRESIYLIEFAFAPNVNSIKQEFLIKKVVITSAIFGKMTADYSNFEDISFDEWAIKGYHESVKIDKCQVTPAFSPSAEAASSSHYWDINGTFRTSDGPVFDNTVLNTLWSKNRSDVKGWIKTSDITKIDKQFVDVMFTKKYNTTISAELKSASVLKGELWDNQSPIRVELLDSDGKQVNQPLSIYRENVKNNKIIEQDVITSRYKIKKYLSDFVGTSFKNVTNINTINDIQTMWLSVRSYDTSMNDKLELKLYNTGVLTFNDDFTNKRWTTITTEIASDDLNEDTLSITSAIPKGILSALGNKQFGILGVRMAPVEHQYGKFKLRHGNSDIKTFAKGGSERLFTYLVMRISLNVDYALLIPLSGYPELWDVDLARSKTGTGSWHEPLLGSSVDFSGLVKTWAQNFLENIRVCSENNALNTYRLMRLSIGDIYENNTSSYTLRFVLNSENNWSFKGYNLLNQQERDRLSAFIGVDNNNNPIVGNLLTSNTTFIPEHVLKAFSIKDSGEPDLGSIITNFDIQIENINALISNPDETINSNLISKMESRNNTKGVYTIDTNNKNEGIFDMIDSEYKSSNSLYFTSNSASKNDITLYIVDDKDTAYLGKVSTILYAS